MKKLNLSGLRFGRLVALSESGRSGRAITWRCICDCGTSCSVRTASLRRGHTLSCGCITREQTVKRNRAAAKHGMHRSNEFSIWLGIRKRCLSPGSPTYKNYGARGITLHPDWVASFESFYAHVGKRPSTSHSIDRIDNTRGYEPGNVRWATPAQQGSNRRTNVRGLIDGVPMTAAEISRATGIPSSTILMRMKKGLTGRALTAPPRRWSGDAPAPAAAEGVERLLIGFDA